MHIFGDRNIGEEVAAVMTPSGFIAYGFGSGLAPWAPGTAGTAAAVPLYFLIEGLPLHWYGLFLVVGFALGVWVCHRTSHLLGVHDHGGIVWDEMIGYWLTMMFAPAGWYWALAGFVAFRFFDIIKPFPIKWADRRVSGGLGIMIDDVLAAIYSMLIMALLGWAQVQFGWSV